VLVGTDYTGLGTNGPHPYLIGEGEARSALDSVRAARQLPELKLENRTVVWGHSQGGHAALWTGAIGFSYAPDVNIAGVAALAPATDLLPLLEAAEDTIVGKVMASFLMTAYSATYADVQFDRYAGPDARARDMATRCLSGRGALLSILVAATLRNRFLRIAEERTAREASCGKHAECSDSGATFHCAGDRRFVGATRDSRSLCP
jgi:hypothetical protein